jgi:hypothetical protein
MKFQGMFFPAEGCVAASTIAVAALVVVAISRAQTESAAPPNPGAKDESVTQPARQIDVPGNIQKARGIFDQLDANLADVPSREQLSEVERLIDEGGRCDRPTQEVRQ